MATTQTGYRNRMQVAWSNLQANRGLRPVDLINGYRMVHPLRALAGPGEPFDVATLAMELFTRLQIRYQPHHPVPAPIRPETDLPRTTRGERRVGLFIDAPDHLSGVAMTLNEWRTEAARAGHTLVVHTCAHRSPEPGLVAFPPMGTIGLEVYDGLRLSIPRFDDVLDYIRRMRFDAIHVSTPGPMGLLGLLAARQRGLPVYGTYHTDFPRYARTLTGDPAFESFAWKFMRWFYGQLDRVAAPTESVRRDLADHGFEPARIEVVGRGVDTTRFLPGLRDPAWRTTWGSGKSLVLLYVGRLSREKNLDVLLNAFLRLIPRRPDLGLVFVGDGPHRAALERLATGAPVRFTGSCTGDALARAYASSDLFVFPSTTDTFGRVVLEAQASGLPVVVSDAGGPKHAMRDGITGVVVPDLREDNLAAALDAVTNEPARMNRLARAARRYATTQSLEASFNAFWNLHRAAVHQPAGERTP
ncbi:MAG TPA: glycosyltransferase family 1 protein [Kiritimatiellia bacterium]|nr:glycosyltransferase family 1 protein [Kiritimatiellia bacterium]HMP32903.1 glycosyltransferase family 1 protein [Kiritimatiellia bacterium]